MTVVDFITELFCRVADQIVGDKPSQAKLYPSEVVNNPSHSSNSKFG